MIWFTAFVSYEDPVGCGFSVVFRTAASHAFAWQIPPASAPHAPRDAAPRNEEVSDAVHPSCVDDASLGKALRAVRVRRGWSQRELATRSRVSASLVSLVERGHIEPMSLRSLRAVASALEVRLVVLPRWRGGELDRLVKSGHAALHEEVARYLDSMPGWRHAPEVSFSIYGERGVIDILAFHEPTATVLVIELKTELASLEDLLGTMDRRLRLAPRIARERGWEALSVSGWVVIAESRTNRRRVQNHSATLRSAFPADGHAVRTWLRRPVGSVRALSLWTNSNHGARKQEKATRMRVGRPQVPASAGHAARTPELDRDAGSATRRRAVARHAGSN